MFLEANGFTLLVEQALKIVPIVSNLADCNHSKHHELIRCSQSGNVLHFGGVQPSRDRWMRLWKHRRSAKMTLTSTTFTRELYVSDSMNEELTCAAVSPSYPNSLAII